MRSSSCGALGGRADGAWPSVSALVNKDAETDARYRPIVALHVEFVKRGLGFRKFVDTIEFRKETNGAFARHQT
jgi:hypothetical protein